MVKQRCAGRPRWPAAQARDPCPTASTKEEAWAAGAAGSFICQSELAPPVRAHHTVYVTELLLLGGQTYCLHHIIEATVVAGGISEAKTGTGPDFA